MHDNINHTGQNWTGRTPRTMGEAFPHAPGSIGGEWGRAVKASKEAERVRRRDDLLVLLVLALCFVGGIILAPVIDALLRGGLF